MVAYSFKAQFARKVEDGTKRQTVRADRRRHAKAGEPIQLYYGLRTTVCRKLIEDPICKAVRPIFISAGHITIDGRLLDPREANAFAVADGFDTLGDFLAFFARDDGSPFHGVVIEW